MEQIYNWVMIVEGIIILGAILGRITLTILVRIYEQEHGGEVHKHIITKRKNNEPLNEDESMHIEGMEANFRFIRTIESYTNVMLGFSIVLLTVAILLNYALH